MNGLLCQTIMQNKTIIKKKSFSLLVSRSIEQKHLLVIVDKQKYIKMNNNEVLAVSHLTK
jgi:hypothetical protein